MTSAMAMLGADASQATVGTTLLTSYGQLKAELVSHGMLQTSFEGFQPLPMVNLNTQLAWVPQGLAGGVLQGVMLTPVGMLMGCVNTGGQLSGEFLTAVQPYWSPNSQIMVGVHTWGVPGLRCGYKAALEWQYQVLDGEDNLVGASSVTLACTTPFVAADGSPLAETERSTSLSVFHRTSPKHSMFASMEWPAKGEHGHLAVGGTRQLSDHARLRGKWGTQGLLALALEVAGDKSSMTFSTELSSSAPKFGVTVALSP